MYNNGVKRLLVISGCIFVNLYFLFGVSYNETRLEVVASRTEMSVVVRN